MIKISVVCALVFTWLLAACNNSGSSQPTSIVQTDTPVVQVALRTMSGCDELNQKLIDNWVENLLARERYLPGLAMPTITDVQEDGLSNSAGGASADSAPDDVSQTNTQESGVDEADIIKADSQGNLYIAQHDTLVVVDAWPASTMNRLSTLELGGTVTGVYLSEQDNLVVALVRTGQSGPDIGIVDDSISPYIWWNDKTDLVFIDISDKADPVINRRMRLDGELVSSRSSAGRLHLVQNFYLQAFADTGNDVLRNLLEDFHQAFVAEDEAAMACIRADIRSHIAENINEEGILELLPAYRDVVSGQNGPEQTMSCASLYAPIIDTSDNHLLVVTSVDLSGDNINRVAAIGSGWTVYASKQDLFVVQPGFSWWWRPHQRQQSAIHHFSLSDQQPVYLTTGLVNGYVTNTFSLSYFENHLRVATTENFWGLSDRSDIRSTNHLTVLADNQNNTMDVIGAVTKFADNERIFSARFIEEKAYVVTFRQIDPLFSFDLSDPAKPFIAGELKIPGFSNYMHPIGDNHLLTIGRDGDDEGAIDQVAIKLFDVSDLSQPLLVDSYVPALGNGYSWSEANWDHHAFTYYAPEKLLAVPLSSYNFIDNDYFMGMLVLNVDLDSGLSLAGLVDHEDLVQQAPCSNGFTFCDREYFRWLSQPTRSVFMSQQAESFYYSLSNIGLKGVSTEDLNSTVGSLLFKIPEDYYAIYY